MQYRNCKVKAWPLDNEMHAGSEKTGGVEDTLTAKELRINVKS